MGSRQRSSLKSPPPPLLPPSLPSFSLADSSSDGPAQNADAEISPSIVS